jgi:hypothetical protein
MRATFVLDLLSNDIPDFLTGTSNDALHVLMMRRTNHCLVRAIS